MLLCSKKNYSRVQHLHRKQYSEGLFVQSLLRFTGHCIYFQYGWPQWIRTHWTGSCGVLLCPSSCLQYAYVYIMYTDTHTSQHTHTDAAIHQCFCMCSIILIHVCDSCVDVCSWINIKVWTGSLLKTTYGPVLVMTYSVWPRDASSQLVNCISCLSFSCVKIVRCLFWSFLPIV